MKNVENCDGRVFKIFFWGIFPATLQSPSSDSSSTGITNCGESSRRGYEHGEGWAEYYDEIDCQGLLKSFCHKFMAMFKKADKKLTLAEQGIKSRRQNMLTIQVDTFYTQQYPSLCKTSIHFWNNFWEIEWWVIYPLIHCNRVLAIHSCMCFLFLFWRWEF